MQRSAFDQSVFDLRIVSVDDAENRSGDTEIPSIYGAATSSFVRVSRKACLIAAFLVGVGCHSSAGQNGLDREALLHDLATLSSDEYEGRETGTPGGEKARAYLESRFRAVGLAPCGSEYEHPFVFGSRGGSEVSGVNLLGTIRGSESTGHVIVVSAHYDHVGTRNGEIYNGADDNASGAAALVALAHHFKDVPPRNTIVIAAFDAEEKGLQGARAFLENPCIDRESIAMNVNLDMISRSEANELYAAGTHHYPELRSVLEDLQADEGEIQLIFGHDEPGTGRNDWTSSSDQGPFHATGIPFIYFGVEDHDGYHRPTDDFEFITPDFYANAVVLIQKAIEGFDAELEHVVSERENR